MTSDLERTRFDARTRVLLEGPILSTLMRLATPNVLVMLVQASVGLIETYFIGKLGTDALAGVTLVFPRADADDVRGRHGRRYLVRGRARSRCGPARRCGRAGVPRPSHRFRLRARLHARRPGCRPDALRGDGRARASLAAALTYSNVVFSAAVMVWTFNSLANVIRGSGNMLVPAIVTSIGALVLIPLSPCLIFGWGPFPRLGVAGGAVAVVAGGAWFGPISWPVLRRTYAVVRD